MPIAGNPVQPLSERESSALRERITSQFANAENSDQLARVAYVNMASKNRLLPSDSLDVEQAFKTRMVELERGQDMTPGSCEKRLTDMPARNDVGPLAERQPQPVAMASAVTPIQRPPRRRNKRHLLFVASQPCLVCQRSPADAHHLKFAQTKALGRKVSDEYTVPLCREHHQDLHTRGDERTFWADLGMTPLETAKELWAASMKGSAQPGAD